MYSCIAWVNDVGKPEVVLNRDGDQTTPSVVHFETPDNVSAGQAAKEKLTTNPTKVAPLFKRQIGEQDRLFPSLGPEPLTPQKTSRHVLRKLVNDAGEHLRPEQPIRDVVITVAASRGRPHLPPSPRRGSSG